MTRRKDITNLSLHIQPELLAELEQEARAVAEPYMTVEKYAIDVLESYLAERRLKAGCDVKGTHQHDLPNKEAYEGKSKRGEETSFYDGRI